MSVGIYIDGPPEMIGPWAEAVDVLGGDGPHAPGTMILVCAGPHVPGVHPTLREAD